MMYLGRIIIMKRKILLIIFFILTYYAIIIPLSAEPVSKKITIKALAYGSDSNQEGWDWIRAVEKYERENPDVDIQYELLYDEAYHNRVKQCLKEGGESIPDIAYIGVYYRWSDPWKEAGQQFDHRPII